MIQVPGGKPFIPPMASPKEVKPKEEVQEEAVSRPIPPPKEGNKGPELDARAIAVRMAALASEAKKKELSFEEIIQRAIDETGMTNPQAAMEEASRKLQKEIEDELDLIKSNKEMMDEAEAWQTFGEILEQELSQDQVSSFLEMLKDNIRNI
ncbi:MAG: hypothetical protein WC624_02205 [Candidatus Margulisiibacteriota bacterium]